MLNNLARLDLNLLRTFTVLMEEQSVSQAALRLGLSQPATSNALNRLRARLGDDLLVRRGNVMRPTPLAIEFLPYVQTALGEVARGLDRIAAFDPAEMNGNLVIGIDQYSLVTLGAALVSSLRRAAPNLNISLVNAPPHVRDDGLIKGEFDFLIGQVWTPNPQIAQEILFTENFVGLVRSGHPLVQGGGPVPLDNYLAYPHVMFSEVGRVRRNVDQGLAQINRTRIVNVTLPSLTLAAEFVEASDEIINLGQAMTAALKQRYDLVSFDIPLAVPSFDLALQWPSQNDGAAMNVWFRQLVGRLVP